MGKNEQGALILINKLIEIARSAGRIIENHKMLPLAPSFKNDKSLVTNADFASNKYIVNALRSHGIPILSEESTSNEEGTTFFAVDPLDGSLEFLKSIDNPSFDQYAVQIAEVRDGTPTRGVVYQPAIDKLYFAEKGKGSFVLQNGATTQIHTQPSSKMVVGRYNLDADLQDYLHRNHENSEVHQGGSFGVKVCHVAEGRFGKFIHTNFDPSKVHASLWDSAAPDIILWEAGGRSYEIKTRDQVKYDLANIDLVKGYVAEA